MNIFIGAAPYFANHNNLKWKYISAPCGAGKTRYILQRATDLYHDSAKVLILMPSILAIEETSKRLRKDNDLTSFLFHNENAEGKVSDHLINHLINHQDRHITFATHQVLLHLDLENRRILGDMHLFVDEALQVSQELPTFKFKDSYSYFRLKILNRMEFEECPGTDFSRVTATETGLKSIARNDKQNDEIQEVLSERARILSNANWNSYVSTTQLDKFQNEWGTQLTFHCILKPDLLEHFASVLVAGANFEKTIMYQIWQDRFEKDSGYVDEVVRYNQQISIHYVTDMHWSKTLAGQNDNLDKIIKDGVTQTLGDEPFIFRANKGRMISLGDNANQLPNKLYSLDQWKSYHNVAFLSAINPSPWNIKFLMQIEKIDDAAIREAFYYEDVYQAIMRTSLRNPKASEPVKIFVVDIGAAEYLKQNFFPDADLVHVDVGIERAKYVSTGRSPGRPRKWNSNTQRQAAYRRRRTKLTAQSNADEKHRGTTVDVKRYKM